MGHLGRRFAYFIFLILTSKENDWQQVEILRIIAKTMSDRDTREALVKAADSYELWNILEQKFTHHRVLKTA